MRKCGARNIKPLLQLAHRQAIVARPHQKPENRQPRRIAQSLQPRRRILNFFCRNLSHARQYDTPLRNLQPYFRNYGNIGPLNQHTPREVDQASFKCPIRF